MTRLIDAEAAYFPPGLYETWKATGPRRVRQEVASRLAQLADAGLIRLDGDPERAARNLVLLVSPASDEDASDAHVDAGVHVLLHGYGS